MTNPSTVFFPANGSVLRKCLLLILFAFTCVISPRGYAENFDLPNLRELPVFQQTNTPIQVPHSALPAGFPPVYILSAPNGTSEAATASRHHTEEYDNTTKCVLRLNTSSPVWLMHSDRKSTPAFLAPLSNTSYGRRDFILVHELAHCIDVHEAPGSLTIMEKFLWKEVFADMVAVLVLRRSGVDSHRFESMAFLRGKTADDSLTSKWQGALRDAARMKIASASDADLIKMAVNYRIELFK